MNEYGSKSVSVVVNGVPITGMMDGEFLTVTPSVEPVALHVGADGEATRVDNADESGTIVIRLKQTSLSNAVLSVLRATKATFAIIIKDTRGTSIHAGAKAFVSGATVISYGQVITAREWTISVAKLVDFIGGNPDI
ncbi:MAG: DUF3277 family protein [Candidatus Hydrogenedentes bacterium]|nr:DUF3277 family protein [Candidatus Hydrogenedentota bacterium]